MLNSGVLDLGIGLAFVYLMLSLICTVVNEWVAHYLLNLRAQTLEKGIRNLLSLGLGDENLVDKIYDHPLVKALSPPDRRPSYLPARVFALALLDALPKTGQREFDTKQLSEDASKALSALLPGAEKSFDAARPQIERWFDDSMNRVSGWYKRKMQAITLGVAAVVVISANADTLQIASRLWTMPTLREAIVEHAKIRAQQPPPLNIEYANPDSPMPSALVATPPAEGAATAAPVLSPEDREALGQLMGWSEDREAYRRFLDEANKQERQGSAPPASSAWWVMRLWDHLLGWFVTVIAISLGAPFWFDTLQRFINIRSAGQVPEKSQGPEKGQPS